MADARYEQLTQLGTDSPIPASPSEAVLETVANPHAGAAYLVRFTCPEFTTLCPVTGQPDFAHLVIDYAPAKRLVESGVTALGLAALDERADPTYDHEVAARLVQMGWHVAAMTPGELANWVAEKVRR